MLHTGFDALEATLRQLTEIVDRNHKETATLVKQMTSLVDEMKAKTGIISNAFPPPVARLK